MHTRRGNWSRGGLVERVRIRRHCGPLCSKLVAAVSGSNLHRCRKCQRRCHHSQWANGRWNLPALLQWWTRPFWPRSLSGSGPPSLTFTWYCFTSSRLCTSQSSFHLSARLHCPHCCNTIARRLGNIRPPLELSLVCHTGIPYTIHILVITMSCKDQRLVHGEATTDRPTHRQTRVR